MKLEYKIKHTDTYENIKQVLKCEFAMSDRLILKLKNNNKIFLNSSPSPVWNSVKSSDLIELFIDWEEDNSNVVPYKMDLNIIYEDECYLVLNKPAGIAIHPSCLHFDNSLSNAVRYYFDNIGLKKKIRPVNRLDKDTSGLVIFAKNEYVQECLVKQMKTNTFKKEYLAIVYGIMEKDFDTINLPIARKKNSIIERTVDSRGDIAITHYNVISTKNNMSYLELKIDTGRTHQIRVHLSYLGHPIIGDSLYGSSSDLINRQALHSHKISFVHPITKLPVSYVADIPNDFGFYFH